MKFIISLFESIRDLICGTIFTIYLYFNPRIRSLMGLEIDHPLGAEHGSWLYYDYWPNNWKRRLRQFYLSFVFDRPLAKENPLPLSTEQISNYILYRNVELARDTYLAQVAHSLFLERKRRVPWRFADWSDHELSFLLSSKVCFKALRSFPEDELYYGVYVSSRTEASENILDDPRKPFQFMQQESEQGNKLLGDDPSQTAKDLSGWFHDYLSHNPSSAYGFSSGEFHKSHPLLMDRLVRYDIEPYENSIYVTPAGCGSASSLFVDLMRAVNIPIRKVRNEIEGYDGNMEQHSGIIFDWQGGSGNGRYLLHTDDLYTSSYFKDTAPNPPDENRGIMLWDHVWLNPTEFGQHFNYDPRPDILATASIAQKEKYWYLRDKLSCSSNAISSARNSNVDDWITFLQGKGCTEEEARRAWENVIATVTAYGDGDLELGYQRLLDGTDSRHARWCNRTGKC
jgi:hypothetical protein